MAGMTAKDIDVAELYDAFTLNTIMFLEISASAPRVKAALHLGAGLPRGTMP